MIQLFLTEENINIIPVKTNITKVQEGFNAKLNQDYTTILNEYGTAEEDIKKETGTIE